MTHLVYVLNADWYFDLHWKERAVNASKNGFKVSVIVPNDNPNLCKELGKSNIDLFTYKMHRTSLSLFGELKSFRSLYKIIKRISPDIIHSVTIKPNLYCSVISMLLSISLVTTYAGLGMMKTSQMFKYKIVRLIVFFIIRFSSNDDRCTAMFENNQDLDFFSEKNILSNDKLIRVYGAGVNLESYFYSKPKKNESPFKILFASRLLKDKGLTELVDAVSILKSEGYSVVLNVAGIFDHYSPLAFSTDEILELENSDKISWLGKRDDIPRLISESDIVALPTVYGEGVPRILIEACSVGRPVIATDIGGCQDICIDGLTGFSVIPNSTDCIVAAVKRFILEPELIEKLGANGRQLVEDKFSNESVFEQHLAIYKNL